MGPYPSNGTVCRAQRTKAARILVGGAEICDELELVIACVNAIFVSFSFDRGGSTAATKPVDLDEKPIR